MIQRNVNRLKKCICLYNKDADLAKCLDILALLILGKYALQFVCVCALMLMSTRWSTCTEKVIIIC